MNVQALLLYARCPLVPSYSHVGPVGIKKGPFLACFLLLGCKLTIGKRNTTQLRSHHWVSSDTIADLIPHFSVSMEALVSSIINSNFWEIHNSLPNKEATKF